MFACRATTVGASVIATARSTGIDATAGTAGLSAPRSLTDQTANNDEGDADATPRVVPPENAKQENGTSQENNRTRSATAGRLNNNYANLAASQARAMSKRYMQYYLGSMILAVVIFTLGVITPFMGWVPPIRLPWGRY